MDQTLTWRSADGIEERPSADGGGTGADRAALVGAMTVDVEDYFHVAALSQRVRREDWDRLPARVERNVDAVLAMFADFDVRATFFTLGWVAERFPSVIHRIVDGGHELASHGCEHARVDSQTPEAFRADVSRARKLLEDIGGRPVRGYRAATFSISERTPWAFEILAEAGYGYSSSIYPLAHDLYGMPTAPRFLYRPVPDAEFVEVPVTTVEILGQRRPCGGGGFFRLLPYTWSRWALRRVHATDRQPAVFYFHPWEIDPDQPRIGGLSFRSRFRHYTNLQRMEAKLRLLLTEFHWGRLDELLERQEAVRP
jgi:polysaccharide deacetylase family protein (PEP-CTERM system associated)